MRIDITQIIKVCVMNGIKSNYSKIARQFNVIQELLSINFLNKISNSNNRYFGSIEIYKIYFLPN